MADSSSASTTGTAHFGVPAVGSMGTPSLGTEPSNTSTESSSIEVVRTPPLRMQASQPATPNATITETAAAVGAGVNAPSGQSPETGVNVPSGQLPGPPIAPGITDAQRRRAFAQEEKGRGRARQDKLVSVDEGIHSRSPSRNRPRPSSS